jgi:hypothetical protein
MEDHMRNIGGVDEPGWTPEFAEGQTITSKTTVLGWPARPDAVPAAFSKFGRRGTPLHRNEAIQFGLGATPAPPPSETVRTAQRTLAVNVQWIAPTRALCFGRTRQLAYFPPTPEYPAGRVEERRIRFVELCPMRIGTRKLPGYKYKLGEKNTLRDLSDGSVVPVED